MIFLGAAGLPSDAVARRIGLPAGAVRNDEAQQRAHFVAGIFGEDSASARRGVLAVDLQQGRRAVDAAVEQGRIAACKVQRSDGDARPKPTVMVSTWFQFLPESASGHAP